jgi:hypothetical protein
MEFIWPWTNYDYNIYHIRFYACLQVHNLSERKLQNIPFKLYVPIVRTVLHFINWLLRDWLFVISWTFFVQSTMISISIHQYHLSPWPQSSSIKVIPHYLSSLNSVVVLINILWLSQLQHTKSVDIIGKHTSYHGILYVYVSPGDLDLYLLVGQSDHASSILNENLENWRILQQFTELKCLQACKLTLRASLFSYLIHPFPLWNN